MFPYGITPSIAYVSAVNSSKAINKTHTGARTRAYTHTQTHLNLSEIKKYIKRKKEDAPTHIHHQINIGACVVA